MRLIFGASRGYLEHHFGPNWPVQRPILPDSGAFRRITVVCSQPGLPDSGKEWLKLSPNTGSACRLQRCSVRPRHPVLDP